MQQCKLEQSYTFLDRAAADRAIQLCMENAGYALAPPGRLCVGSFASSMYFCYRPKHWFWRWLTDIEMINPLGDLWRLVWD